jgi:hypothetical protein
LDTNFTNWYEVLSNPPETKTNMLVGNETPNHGNMGGTPSPPSPISRTSRKIHPVAPPPAIAEEFLAKDPSHLVHPHPPHVSPSPSYRVIETAKMEGAKISVKGFAWQDDGRGRRRTFTMNATKLPAGARGGIHNPQREAESSEMPVIQCVEDGDLVV